MPAKKKKGEPKSKKIVVDKTFGMKNKNKSKKVQRQIAIIRGQEANRGVTKEMMGMYMHVVVCVCVWTGIRSSSVAHVTCGVVRISRVWVAFCCRMYLLGAGGGEVCASTPSLHTDTHTRACSALLLLQSMPPGLRACVCVCVCVGWVHASL